MDSVFPRDIDYCHPAQSQQTKPPNRRTVSKEGSLPTIGVGVYAPRDARSAIPERAKSLSVVMSSQPCFDRPARPRKHQLPKAPQSMQQFQKKIQVVRLGITIRLWAISTSPRQNAKAVGIGVLPKDLWIGNDSQEAGEHNLRDAKGSGADQPSSQEAYRCALARPADARR